jgi:hypothetical protein
MNAREVATCFREDCRTLRDSLQLEMVAAQYCLQMRDAMSHEGIPVGEAVTAGVVAELEHDGDPLAHSILRALLHVGAARRSGHAAARLDANGIWLPSQFADVGEARCAGAWRATEGGRRGEYALFVDFEHPLGTRHALALFVEPRRGGRLRHIGLMPPVRELPPDAPFHADAMEALDLDAAADLLTDVMAREDLAEANDFRLLVAAARARSMRVAPAARTAG